jgi:hypothetical protein
MSVVICRFVGVGLDSFIGFAPRRPAARLAENEDGPRAIGERCWNGAKAEGSVKAEGLFRPYGLGVLNLGLLYWCQAPTVGATYQGEVGMAHIGKPQGYLVNMQQAELLDDINMVLDEPVLEELGLCVLGKDSLLSMVQFAVAGALAGEYGVEELPGLVAEWVALVEELLPAPCVFSVEN